jgi:hypothetical protein
MQHFIAFTFCHCIPLHLHFAIASRQFRGGRPHGTTGNAERPQRRVGHSPCPSHTLCPGHVVLTSCVHFCRSLCFACSAWHREARAFVKAFKGPVQPSIKKTIVKKAVPTRYIYNRPTGGCACVLQKRHVCCAQVTCGSVNRVPLHFGRGSTYG